MEYNLDDGIGLGGLLGLNSPSKVMSVGQRICVKHYSMFDYQYAFVVEMDKHYIKLKFRSGFPELDFFPEDPIVITFTTNDKIFIANGEIVIVESLDPLTIEIKINKIEKKDTLRKNERFYVSLSCSLNSKDMENPIFGIVKNLSYSGFKINSKVDMNPKTPVDIHVSIDKYLNIQCTGRVVRKNKLSLFYEYGIEITDISKNNMLTLQHYINQLKTAQ